MKSKNIFYSVVLAANTLVGCDTVSKYERTGDGVNSLNSNYIGVNALRSGGGIGLKLPDELMNQTQPVDITDVKAVAKAMGVKLNGDKNQKLFDLTIGTITTENHGQLNQDIQKIPVTPENLKSFAQFFNTLENTFVSDSVRKANHIISLHDVFPIPDPSVKVGAVDSLANVNGAQK